MSGDQLFTVMTVGTFDRFHEGHRELLKWCGRLARWDQTEVIVGVNSDEFVSQYKSREPAQAWIERATAIEETLMADHVVLNPQKRVGDSMLPLLAMYRPNVLMVGDDWMGPQYLEQIGVASDELWELGITLAFKPRGPNPIHSSQTRS